MTSFEITIYWDGGVKRGKQVLTKDFPSTGALNKFARGVLKEGIEISQGDVVLHLPGRAISLIESRKI